MSFSIDAVWGVLADKVHRGADTFGSAASRSSSHASADVEERRANAARQTPHDTSCTFVPAPPQAVTVEKGDTTWDYWKAHGRFDEWQPYKAEFNTLNAEILADGWLHPGETALLPADPTQGDWDCPPPQEPEPEPEPVPTPSTSAPDLPPYLNPAAVPPPAGWHPPMATGAPPAASDSPFTVGPMSSVEATANFGIGALNTLQNLNNYVPDLFAPDLARASIDGMFASDRGQQTSVKLFTPTLKVFNPSGGQYTTGGGSLKFHGWLAERNEIALSPSWVTKDGVRMRSGTFTVTLSGQYEVIGEANLPQGDARAFHTVNEAKVISVTLTTTEDRLHDIMTGEAPAPNAATLEHMEVGDTITISSGPSHSVENELRLLAGKSVARAGADFKMDEWTASSDKFTVKMVAHPDKSVDEPHVLILDGTREAEGSAVGVGLIWNPKLGTTPDGSKGTGPLDSYSEGLFGRILLQSKESAEHETYNFIELNPADVSAGGGRELFDEIIDTGVVSYDADSNSIPGALAVGTMTVDANNGAATLQLTGYHQAKNATAGVNQYLGQYSLDLMTMIDQVSTTHVLQGGSDASVGITGDTKVAARYSEGGFTNYFHDYTVNIADYVSSESFVLTAEGVKKDQMIAALRDGAIADITLHTADGEELTGQDAVTWMRTHEDGWYGGNDEVNVVVNMGSRSNADAFSETFLADQKKFHDDQQDGFFENIFYEIGQDAWESPEMAIATLTAPEVFSIPDSRGHLEAHQEAQNADENFKAMSASGMGNLLSSMNHYWEHAGKSSPYPISVDIYVEWRP